ncbi:hypothetical protein [Amycolatopsis lurida]
MLDLATEQAGEPHSGVVTVQGVSVGGLGQPSREVDRGVIDEIGD